MNDHQVNRIVNSPKTSSMHDGRLLGNLTTIERDIKKLLFEALKETGDNPEDVSCIYSGRSIDLQRRSPTPSGMSQCSATELPESELTALFCYNRKHVYRLVKKDTAIKIETSALSLYGSPGNDDA